MKRPRFLYQTELKILTIKALPSLINGSEAYSRDSVTNLWNERFREALRLDGWDFLAREETSQGRRFLPGLAMLIPEWLIVFSQI